MNTGLDLKKQEEEQSLPEKHLMGAGNYFPILKEDASWVDVWKSLKPETQFGAMVETMGCTGYGTSNIIEMLWKHQYGLDINISDRALNKMSGTTRSGNTVDAPIDTLRKKGWLLEEEWSWNRDTFDWNDYYSAIPSSLLLKAQDRLKNWTFEHEYVPMNAKAMKEALKTSPLGGTVYAWQKDENGIYHDNGYSPNHFTVVILGYVEGKYWLCGDSYPDDFQYNDNPQQVEFIKKLAWNYKFGCVKRYKIIKKNGETSLIKRMINSITAWFDTHGLHLAYTPRNSNGTIIGKQVMDMNLTNLDNLQKIVKLLLKGMYDYSFFKKSNWAEVSRIPDLSEDRQIK